jgi:uncharacterized protein
VTFLEQIERSGAPVSGELLEKAVRRIVESADPDKILLFGSGARGTMGPHSDVDLLVIKGGPYDYHRVITEIYGALAGVEQATEVVLATPELVARYRDSFCLVFYPALREGKTVYDRATVRGVGQFGLGGQPEPAESRLRAELPAELPAPQILAQANLSVAATRARLFGGSKALWPLSGVTIRSASGHARCSAHALSMGQTTS